MVCRILLSAIRPGLEDQTRAPLKRKRFLAPKPGWHVGCNSRVMKEKKKSDDRGRQSKQPREIKKPAQLNPDGAPDDRDPQAQYEDKDES